MSYVNPQVDAKLVEREALICRLGTGYRIKLVAQRGGGSAAP